MALRTADVFQLLRAAYKAGMLESKPSDRTEKKDYEYVPGKRFLENLQEAAEKVNLANIAKKLSLAAPLIRIMGKESRMRKLAKLMQKIK